MSFATMVEMPRISLLREIQPLYPLMMEPDSSKLLEGDECGGKCAITGFIANFYTSLALALT